MLISTAYFPPIEYFALLAKYSNFYIEAHENYVKQSYRNRTRILSSNGVLDLRVPILHDGARLITEIKIDYSTPWVRQTKYAIESAYYNSPFFEYYKDELFAIMDSHPETLWELNSAICQFFCRKIGISPRIESTAEYVVPTPRLDVVSYDGAQKCSECAHRSLDPFVCVDYRYTIHPKLRSDYKAKPYYQVFREKFGFVPNLSIMDLLFNEGPESICYLKD